MNFFGTDGIRGQANIHPLTPEFSMRVVVATAKVLSRHHKGTRDSNIVVIGSDTRRSSQMLIYSTASAAMSMGYDVINLETVPTAGLSYLTKKVGAAFGVMISASHNPFFDNGIKIFGPDGYKLCEDTEAEIEDELFNDDSERPTGEKIGKIKKNNEFLVDPVSEYVEYVSSLIEKSHDGKKKLKIVFDGANGAASPYIRKIFENRFNIELIHCHPDGININFNCGSTHMDQLAKTVISSHANLGVAFDGDSDRALFIDEHGNAIDGDHIIAMLAIDMKQKDILKNNIVITTVMSNLGFVRAMKENNINLITTAVGDRNVLNEMIRRGGVIGGEQSGHVILLDKNHTGDGLITAVSVINLVKRSGKKLSELAGCVQKYPQVLINIAVAKDKNLYKTDPEIVAEIKKSEEKFLNRGRILIRPSGTENLIRVMIEGESKSEITSTAERIAGVIKKNMS